MTQEESLLSNKRGKLINRLVGTALFFPSAAVLGTAIHLSPDPSGMGTHKQLGLSECGFLSLTQLPCPMCGMTTTFTHLAHFQIIEGVVNQPFGLILFSGTVVAAVVGGLDLILARGRWRSVLSWLEQRESIVASVLILGMLFGWIYKIALHYFF